MTLEADNQTLIVVEFITNNLISHIGNNQDARYDGYGYINDGNINSNGSYCLIIYETSPDPTPSLIDIFWNYDSNIEVYVILCHESKLIKLNQIFRSTYQIQLQLTSDVKKTNRISEWQREIRNKSQHASGIKNEDIIILRIFSLSEGIVVMNAKQLMVSNPRKLFKGSSVLDADTILQRLNIGHLPIVEDSNNNINLIGLVSDTDILPYMPPSYYPPDDYTEELAYAKLMEATKKHILEDKIGIKIEDINSLIYEDELSSNFLPKFFRSQKPAYNLLMVVNNKQDKQLCGVISWVNILIHWADLISERLLNNLHDLRAIDVATPLENIPFVDESKYQIGSALVQLRNTSHRHIQVIQKNKLIALFHSHELVPYQATSDDVDLNTYFYQLSLTKLTPRHSLEKRTIPYDMPIWVDNGGECVIKKFLDSIVGKDKHWRGRMAGLLIEQPQKAKGITHLLNPYDVIKLLLENSD